MRLVTRFVLGFIVAAIIAGILVAIFDFEFGNISFWQRHGVWLLIFLALFPRLTLLFSSIPFGGFIWWLGWLFAPRFLVAILATTSYWQTNPILVSLAWLMAIGGESAEKTVVQSRVVARRKYQK